jgi:hypothetical protein
MKGILFVTPPDQAIVGAPLAIGVTTVCVQVVAGVAVAGAGFTVKTTGAGLTVLQVSQTEPISRSFTNGRRTGTCCYIT